jgi:PTH1 family peptidyl-tRNA hydrolase
LPASGAVESTAARTEGSGRSSPLRLLVGLGNPGPQYADTRHNAGFWLVDALVRQQSAQFRPDAKYHGDTCRITLADRDLWLLKPMTFMNRSGQAVAALARFHRIAPTEILVIHDDLDLPTGTIRLKRGGGAGGHNGLRDLIAQLGGNDFARLRLGIGHPGDSRDVLGYVLQRTPAPERALIETAIVDALREVPQIIAGEWAKAMQTLHSRRIESTSAPASLSANRGSD